MPAASAIAIRPCRNWRRDCRRSHESAFNDCGKVPVGAGQTLFDHRRIAGIADEGGGRLQMEASIRCLFKDGAQRRAQGNIGCRPQHRGAVARAAEGEDLAVRAAQRLGENGDMLRRQGGRGERQIENGDAVPGRLRFQRLGRGLAERRQSFWLARRPTMRFPIARQSSEQRLRE